MLGGGVWLLMLLGVAHIEVVTLCGCWQTSRYVAGPALSSATMLCVVGT